MSFTRLRIHLVWATKLRRRVIDHVVEPIVFDAIRRRADEVGAHIIVIGGVEDHIHIIIAIRATHRICDIVRELKSESSKAVRTALPAINFEWQVGYGAFSLRADDYSTACSYVARQKEHHKRNTLAPIFEKLDD